MKSILAFKSHSGWAALVAVAFQHDELHILDRRRIELVKSDDAASTKQPYHAAEQLESKSARALVKRAITAARHCAVAEMRAAVQLAKTKAHEVTGCAVIVGETMPDWSVDEILAVHFRMHKAEGALFQNVLCHAAEKCGLPVVKVPAKRLREIEPSLARIQKRIATLGKIIGPPWASDQKDATLAAAIAWQELC